MKNEFIVIHKTFGECPLAKTQPWVPKDWPGECEEFPTLEAAQSAHPGKRVFTIDQYLHFKEGLDHGYNEFQAHIQFVNQWEAAKEKFNGPKPKPWWKRVKLHMEPK